MIDKRQARLLAGIWWNASYNGTPSPLEVLFRHAIARPGMTLEVLGSIHASMYLGPEGKAANLFELADLLEYTIAEEGYTLTKRDRQLIADTIRTLPPRPTHRTIALRFAAICLDGSNSRQARERFLLQCGVPLDVALEASESPSKA